MNRSVWFAGAAAILPLATLCAAQPPAAPTGVFAPPASPMLLTRTLRHVMHDGTAVVTRRSYRVRFVAAGAGFRLEGTLSDVAVEAPPGLEALANLERLRPDPGIFPIALDASGLIVPAPDPAPTVQQHQAIGTASAEIDRLGLTPAETAQAQGFVGRFQARPFRTGWPLDLFRPGPGTRRDERTITVSGGPPGRVTTDIGASVDAASGLLRSFERKVTTDLEGDRRVVIEEWTLTPAP